MQVDYQELDKKARLGAFSTLDAEVIVPYIQHIKPGRAYVEIGVDKGKSLSIARMVAPKKTFVVGVDLKVNPDVPDTLFLQGDSVAMAKKYEDTLGIPIQILFIDGDHSYQGCKRDLDAWYPLVLNLGYIFFHDHDESSPGVMQAAAEFVNTHTVNLYKVFKRTDKNTSMAMIWL
jgi:hypothetical protein